MRSARRRHARARGACLRAARVRRRARVGSEARRAREKQRASHERSRREARRALSNSLHSQPPLPSLCLTRRPCFLSLRPRLCGIPSRLLFSTSASNVQRDSCVVIPASTMSPRLFLSAALAAAAAVAQQDVTIAPTNWTTEGGSVWREGTVGYDGSAGNTWAQARFFYYPLAAGSTYCSKKQPDTASATPLMYLVSITHWRSRARDATSLTASPLAATPLARLPSPRVGGRTPGSSATARTTSSASRIRTRTSSARAACSRRCGPGRPPRRA